MLHSCRHDLFPAFHKTPTLPALVLQGALRIAHCGGIHIDVLNQLIKAVNLVAKLLHKWVSSEQRLLVATLGAMPVLSMLADVQLSQWGC